MKFYSIFAAHLLRNTAVFSAIILFCACSQAPVRSTVDSYGEQSLDRNKSYFFTSTNLTLLEKQATEDCKLAARAAQLRVVETSDPRAIAIELHTKMLGAEQVIRSNPGFGSSFGVFGGNSGLGLGIGAGNDLTSTREVGREIDLVLYAIAEEKISVREIQIRSVGRENSVSAVAFEMCVAAFRDFPQNLKGRVYEIEVKKK